MFRELHSKIILYQDYNCNNLFHLSLQEVISKCPKFQEIEKAHIPFREDLVLTMVMLIRIIKVLILHRKIKAAEVSQQQTKWSDRWVEREMQMTWVVRIVILIM